MPIYHIKIILSIGVSLNYHLYVILGSNNMPIFNIIKFCYNLLTQNKF
jgi:hypothetical protein